MRRRVGEELSSPTLLTLERASMGIVEQVTGDLTAAMKAKDAVRVEALRLIRAVVLKKQKEKGAKEVDDTVMVQLLRTMANQHRESIEQFERGSREDLVAKEQAQLAIIESYLPAPVDDQLVEQVIEGVIAQTGATGPRDIGKVMAGVMKKLKECGGLVDGGAVNAKVRARLGPTEG
ncbi:MAG TPA: GatB/YqeY domain-containing protein [Firmicutes bacterium]|nr:GatB/YqeY domain-containing protein [Bacillota bacterium]